MGSHANYSGEPCGQCGAGDWNSLEAENARLRAEAADAKTQYGCLKVQEEAALKERNAARLEVEDLRKKFDIATVGGILGVRICPSCNQKWPEFGVSSFMTCYRCRHKAEVETLNVRLQQEKEANVRHGKTLMDLSKYASVQVREAASALGFAKDAINSAWAALGDNLESQSRGGKGIEKSYAYQVQSELRAASERVCTVLEKIGNRADGGRGPCIDDHHRGTECKCCHIVAHCCSHHCCCFYRCKCRHADWRHPGRGKCDFTGCGCTKYEGE